MSAGDGSCNSLSDGENNAWPGDVGKLGSSWLGDWGKVKRGCRQTASLRVCPSQTSRLYRTLFYFEA